MRPASLVEVLLLPLWLLTVLPWLVTPGLARAEDPRLIVQITIDQLRGDMPLRDAERFGEGGFRRFLDRGLVYTNAHLQHSATFTATGHATLATGGNVPEHGLAANDWIDRNTGEQVYCVEDPRYQVIGVEPLPHQGTSPRNLTASTFADELVLAGQGRPRAFSVSIKDRAAILLAGQLGTAYWYDAAIGGFVTSTYYMAALPGWVTQWNARPRTERVPNPSWTLSRPREQYRTRVPDDRPYELPPKGMGRVFPHDLGALDDPLFASALRFTPMGDELTADFAIEILEREKLGRGDTTDFLAISFSVTDYIGHAFGPSSLEQEDNIYRLDRTLARLLKAIDDTVGIKHSLIVLSADHGVDEIPEYKEELGMEAGRHSPARFIADANKGLKEQFGIAEDLVAAFWNPSLYLDLEAVARLGLDVAEVERALARLIMQEPGFELAVARTDLLAGGLPDTPLHRRVERAFHPERTGNVYVVQSPSWLLYPRPERFAAMHGSPYHYDTHVPIYFLGRGVRPGQVSRPVAPRDIAPTLSALLRIEAPDRSVGTPLQELVSRP